MRTLKPFEQLRAQGQQALFLSIVCALVLCAHHAAAQLSISPTIIEESGYPGGLQTFSVSVSNGSEIPLNCQMEVAALAMGNGGLPIAVPEAPRSAAPWLSLDPTQFTLDSKEGKRVLVTMRVPANVVGGYYAVVSCYAKPQLPDEKPEAGGISAGIRFSYRSTAVVLITVPGPELKAVIDAGVPMLEASSTAGGYVMQLPLRNRGNIHARMHGTVRVDSEAGQQLEEFSLEAGRGFLLPDQERLFTSRGSVRLPDGLYVAHVRLDMEQGRFPMTRSFSFFVEDGSPSIGEMTPELRAKLDMRSTGFAVLPSSLELRIRPGGRRTEAIEVMNLTDQEIPVEASIMEWFRTPEGRDLVAAEVPPHGQSAAPALSLPVAEIVLPPRGKRRVSLLTTVPDGAQGDAYAAVFFGRSDKPLDKTPANQARRSTLVTVSAEGESLPKAEIESFSFEQAKEGGGTFSLRYKNAGNITLVPEITFSILDDRNASLARERVSEVRPVQAGAASIVKQPYREVLGAEATSVQVSLRYAQKDAPVIQTVPLTKGAAGQNE